MAKKSAAAKQRRKELLQFIKSLKPMSLQTAAWFKLCSIAPSSRPKRMIQFYYNVRGDAFLIESSGITQHHLSSLPFSHNPDRRTITRVYQNLEKNRLGRLDEYILEMIFDAIDPEEGGGRGVLSQFALTKAVFPLLEHHWDKHGNNRLDTAVGAVLRSTSLVRLPQIKTTFRDDEIPHTAQDEYHQSWALQSSSVNDKVHPYHHRRSCYTQASGDDHLPLDWKSSFRTQLQQLYFSHLKTAHGGVSPELALSCLMGTPDSPPCDLAEHYNQSLLESRRKHIAINVEQDSLEDFEEVYPGQTTKRVLLSTEELGKLQRLLVLKNFTSERGLKAWKGMMAEDGLGRYDTVMSLDEFMREVDAEWIVQELEHPVRYPASLGN